MAWTDPPRTWVDGEIPTQTTFNTHVRDQFKEVFHEVAYVEFTSDVTTSAASEAAPLDVVSSGAITYVANPILVEFYTPFFNANGSGGLSLWDASTDLGRLWVNLSGGGTVFAARRLTPTAASHTYKVRLWQTGGSGSSAHGGAGGAGVDLPGYIRVLQRGG